MDLPHIAGRASNAALMTYQALRGDVGNGINPGLAYCKCVSINPALFALYKNIVECGATRYGN
jgi:hypothetical protein